MNLLERVKAVQLNNKVYSSAIKASPIKRIEELSEDELKGIISLYEKEVKYVDSEIGSFLEVLEQMDIDLENTYIILTADHGEEFMEHGELEHHRKLYDELIHVPLVICGPGISGNKEIRDQVSLIDITPTILDLLDYKPVNNFQGSSLIPLIKCENVPKRAAISEYCYIENIKGYSLRTEEHKYILKMENRKTYSELYNVLKDPQEINNIAGEEVELTRKFEKILLRHILEEQKIKRLIK